MVTIGCAGDDPFHREVDFVGCINAVEIAQAIPFKRDVVLIQELKPPKSEDFGYFRTARRTTGRGTHDEWRIITIGQITATFPGASDPFVTMTLAIVVDRSAIKMP